MLAGALLVPAASAGTGPSYAASDISVYVQGQPMSEGAGARLENGISLVPLRSLAEALGATVAWEDERQTAIVTKADTTVELTIGSSTGVKNGSPFELGAAPKLESGILLVPVRAVSETFDMLVRWDAAEAAVHLDRIAPLPVVGSLANLTTLMEKAAANSYGGLALKNGFAAESTAGGATFDSAASAPAAPSANAGSERALAGSAGAGGDFSATNVQVEGVDEADVVKTDGRYIYQVNRQRIVIAEALPADRMNIVSTIEFEQGDERKQQQQFTPQEMYIDDKHLVVIGNAFRHTVMTDPAAGIMPDAKRLMLPRPGAQTTKAIVYDLTDRANLKPLREIELEGGYVSSRKIGSSLYLITNRYLNYWLLRNPEMNSQGEPPAPSYRDTAVSDEMKTIDFGEIRYFPDAVDPNYMLVAGVNLDKMDQEAQVDAYLGSSRNIYASDKNLYVTVTRYETVHATDTPLSTAPAVDSVAPASPATDAVAPDAPVPSEPMPMPMPSVRVLPGDNQAKSVVYKFRLDAGRTQYVAQGEVPGDVLNQFSMDEYNGHFRIATTVGNVWGTGDNMSKNNVYVLDESLKTVGKLENLAPGEKIYSVRFMGDRAYVVTFKTVDPLFVIDLKNPESPGVLGALKIPGYSDYLHPYDENHIIGFGKDTIELSAPDGKTSMAYYQGMKMAIFDVSDVANPIELHQELIGDRGTDSDLLYNHKALLFSREKNLLAFPVRLHEIRESAESSAKSAAGSPGFAVPAYGQFTFQGAYVYDINLENGFRLKGRITHMTDEDLAKSGMYGGDYDLSVQRILYIGDTLYTLSNAKIKANDMTTLDEKGSLAIP